MSWDRRRATRVSCDFFLNKREGGHMHICQAVNLSLDGIAIAPLLYPIDASRWGTVDLEFTLPGAGPRPLHIQAEKLVVSDELMRLRFTRITHHDFMHLRRWFDALIEEEYMPTIPLLPRWAA